LIALMIWTPYQFAQAGMIGTDQVTQQSTQSDRSTVASFMSRGEVASQLQAFGIDQKTAMDRVASMSDEEVRALSGQIQSLPAGANNDWVWVVLVIAIIAGVVWWAWKRSQPTRPDKTPVSSRAFSFSASRSSSRDARASIRRPLRSATVCPGACRR